MRRMTLNGLNVCLSSFFEVLSTIVCWLHGCRRNNTILCVLLFKFSFNVLKISCFVVVFSPSWSELWRQTHSLVIIGEDDRIVLETETFEWLDEKRSCARTLRDART